MKANQAWAKSQFKQRPTHVVSYLRNDGEFTVWLPQDKRTWRIDDRYGSPVCGASGKPLRFMSAESALVAAAQLMAESAA